MAQYHLVSPKYWPDFRGASKDAKLLGIYVLTCRHRNTEGYYHLPVAYAADDLEMSATAIRKAFSELSDNFGFLEYDDAAQVIFIRKALTYPSQVPKSETQVRGAVNALAHVPPSPLWKSFLAVAATHAPTLRAEFVNGSDTHSHTPTDTPTHTP